MNVNVNVNVNVNEGTCFLRPEQRQAGLNRGLGVHSLRTHRAGLRGYLPLRELSREYVHRHWSIPVTHPMQTRQTLAPSYSQTCPGFPLMINILCLTIWRTNIHIQAWIYLPVAESSPSIPVSSTNIPRVNPWVNMRFNYPRKMAVEFSFWRIQWGDVCASSLSHWCEGSFRALRDMQRYE